MATLRWWRTGPPIPAGLPRTHPLAEQAAERVVRALAGGAQMRWSTLTRYAGGVVDVLDVEAAIWRTIERGELLVGERRDRRGDLRPYALRLAEGVEVAEGESAESPAARERRLVATLRQMIEGGVSLPIPARTLVQQAFGNTKALRVRDHRAAIEAAFDVALEDLVRDHTAAVLAHGPFRWVRDGHRVDARAFFPWVALPEPVLAEMTALEVFARDVVTVENLTAFEDLVHEGVSRTAVVVFTSGFLGRAQRAFLRSLLAAGVTAVRHFGDLDPGGLYIYRDLVRLTAEAAPQAVVSPWRMTVDLLDHQAAQPLTPNDRRRLESYIADPRNPLLDVATAMLHRDRKLEQEALLRDGEGATECYGCHDNGGPHQGE